MPSATQRRIRAERLRTELEEQNFKEETHLRTIARVREKTYTSTMKLPVEELLARSNAEDSCKNPDRKWVLLNLTRDVILLNKRTSEMDMQEKKQLAEITQCLCSLELVKLQAKQLNNEQQSDAIEGLLRKIWFILYQSNMDNLRDYKPVSLLEGYEDTLIEWHLKVKPNNYKTYRPIDQRERQAQLRRNILRMTQSYKELEELAKMEPESSLKRRYYILAIDALIGSNSQERIENEKSLNKDAQRLWTEYALQEIIIATAFNTESESYTVAKEKLFKKIYDDPKCIINRSYRINE